MCNNMAILYRHRNVPEVVHFVYLQKNSCEVGTVPLYTVQYSRNFKITPVFFTFCYPFLTFHSYVVNTSSVYTYHRVPNPRPHSPFLYAREDM
jgi:hypothetical protein